MTASMDICKWRHENWTLNLNGGIECYYSNMENVLPDNFNDILSSDRKDRFRQQIEFILEVDKLKNVLRKTILMDRSRRENSSEHSWHIALMVLILSEYAKDSEVDMFRVMKILLVHDLIEIDAGDTYCYDNQGRKDQPQREKIAADRIFNLLPADQAAALGNYGMNLRNEKPPNQSLPTQWIDSSPSCTTILPRGKSGRKTALKAPK